MSPREIIEYVFKEWAVVQAAPVTFLIIAVAVVGTTYWVSGQLFAARLEAQKEAIATLEGRLKAKDDDLARKSAQISDLEKKINNTPLPQAEIRDPNGIYQSNVKVGAAHGAMRDLSNGIVNFSIIDANGDFNQSSNFDFQDLNLVIVSKGSVSESRNMGIIDRQRFSKVSCKIIARR